MAKHSTSTSQVKHEDVSHGAPDVAGILEKFKLPGFDLEGFIESRKSDIDAVTNATSAAFAGAQAVADKQTELLKTVLTEIGDALNPSADGAPKPVEFVRKQQAFANAALTSTLASMKEIAETARESQSKILEIASSRVRSDVEEIRRMAKRPESHETETK